MLGRSVAIVFVYAMCGLLPVMGADTVQDSTVFNAIMQIADSARLKFAPDKRTAIFELQQDTSGNTGFLIETTIPEAGDYFLAEVKRRSLKSQVRIKTLPDKDNGMPVKGIVNLSVANMRVKPSNQAEMATQALLGTAVSILKQEDGYYLVQTPDHYIAYMDPAGLTPMAQAAFTRWNASAKVIFTADYGHSYIKPDKSADRVSDLVMGDVLQFDGIENQFIRVTYPDGRSGYVSTEDAMDYKQWLSGISTHAENVIRTAKKMMGLPYLWGGTSVKGVDCSGFTKTAFFMNGLIIPRDASQQVLEGTPIDIFSEQGVLDTLKALKQLKAGDLLFFATGQNRDLHARVTHVALYIGNGEFIHSAGKVSINSMLPGASNYGALDTRTLIAVRRYIGEQYTGGLVPLVQHPN